MLKVRFPKIYSFEPFLWIFYVWYYLPFARAFFYSKTYNLIFFGFFVCGCVLAVAQFFKNNKKIPLKFSPLVPVLMYLVLFSLLVLLGVGTAERHIRVSFTFWGTLLVYYIISEFPQAKKRLAVLALTMFLATAVTSTIGVVVNPYAARILTYASNDIAEDLIIRLMNIGGIAFFQGLVVCAPILISFIYQKKYRVLAIAMLCGISISLVFASFTISIAMLLLAFLIGYLANNSINTRTIILVLCVVALICIPWSNVLLAVGRSLGNEKIFARIEAISKFFDTGVISGNMASRLSVYTTSFNTFLEHPWGVGPEYTYITYEKGIGYHSQLFDDLARYGIVAVVFYISFFVGYYHLLKKQWSQINMQRIAFPVSLLYFVFLILNLGFTSAHESVLMFLLIPVLPELILQKQSRENI